MAVSGTTTIVTVSSVVIATGVVFTPNPDANLTVPVAAGTLLGHYTISPSNWTGDFSISGADAGLFALDSSRNLMVGAAPLTDARTYTIPYSAKP